MSGFKEAVAVRRALYQLDQPETEALIARRVDFVAMNSQAIVDRFIEKLRRFPSYKGLLDDFVIHRREDLAAHFAAIFRSGFDDAYEARLSHLIHSGSAGGIGTRLRLAFVTEFFDAVSREICRPLPVVGRRIAAEINAMHRFMLMDTFNAIEHEYLAMHRRVDDRRAAIDGLME